MLNPHPSHPHYRKGDLQYFFDQTDFRKQIATHSNKVAVLVHPTGHGTEDYLNFLPEDLKQEGFEPEVVYL